MATIRQLRFAAVLDSGDFVAGLRQMESLSDSIAGGIGARLSSIKPPALDFAPAGGGGGPGAELAAGVADALGSLPAQVQAGMMAAFTPIGPIVARATAQLQAMVGSVLATNRRLDGDAKFEKTQANLAAIRAGAQVVFGKLGSMARDAAQRMDQGLSSTRWVGRLAAGADAAGRALDKALGGGAWLHKAMNSLEMMGSLASRSARELARINVGPLLGQLPMVGPMMGTVAASADRASSAFKSFGVQALAAVGLVGVGYKAVGFLAAGIKDASDLNEAINKTNVLLGAAAPAVTAFADGMARDFGIAKADTLGVSTAIAGLGKGLGKLDGAELAKFTTDLTQLAADVSSVNNMSMQDVGDALRISLSGEQSDVMKGLGVVINETTVKSYALSHGIGKVGAELTQQQKVMIRGRMALEGLSWASGDLANTIDDPANAYRKLTGSIRNLGAEVGTALMPAVKVAAGVANGVVARLGAAFQAARPAVERLGLALAGGFRVAQAAADHVMPVVSGLFAVVAGAARSGVGAFASWLPSVSSVVGAVKGFVATMTMGLENVLAGIRAFPGFFDAAFGSGPANLLGTLAGWLNGAVVGGIELAGFAIRNMGDLFQLGLLKAGQGVAFLLDNVALIPENLGRVAKFAAGNWLDLMLAPTRAIGRAFAALASSFWEFLKNPSGGFHLNLDGVLADFRKLAAKLPELATAQAIDVSADVRARQESIRAREADYQARLGKPFEMPRAEAGTAKAAEAAAAGAAARVAADAAKAKAGAPDVTEELAKYAKDLAERLKSPLAKFDELMQKARDARAANLIDDKQLRQAEAINRKEAGLADVKFSGALELGSKEAYSSLVSALHNNRGNDTARTAQATLAANQQQVTLLERIAKGIGAAVGSAIPVAKLS